MRIQTFLIGLSSSFLVLVGGIATAGEPGQSPGSGASSARGLAGPSILVETVYPGASAQVVSDTVRAPIAQQITGLDGMCSMRSRCGSDGKYILALTFERGVDLKRTRTLVQDRVNLAVPILPRVVQTAGVNVKERPSGVLMIVNLFSPDGSRDSLYLSNYANIQIKDELDRLPGVGEVTLLGQYDYGLRVWLDPEKLAARKLSVADVVRALEKQNSQVMASEIGKTPVPRGQVFQYSISTKGRLATPEQFADIILKTDGEGSIVRLKDVARVERGEVQRQRQAFVNDKPAAALVIRLIEEVSPRKVRAALREKLTELRKRLPDRLDFAIAFDFTASLEAPERPATPEYLLLDLHLPAGASTQRTLQILKRCAALLRQTPGVQDVLAMSENPFDLFGNDPCILVRLTPAEKRKDGRAEVVRAIRAKLDEIKLMTLRLHNLSGPSRFPSCGYPIDLAVRGPEMERVRRFAEKLAERLDESKKLTDVWANRDSEPRPWRTVDIDGAAAATRGVSKEDIFNALQVYLGTYFVSNFNSSDRTWQINVRVGPGSGDGTKDLLKLKVRNARGQMIPLNAFVKVRETEGPMVLDFLDGRPMVEITANSAPGVKLDAARKLCETLADEVRKELRLPADYRLVWLQETPASR